MSTERDEGLQALQQGNPAAAAPLLETASRQNPDDFELFLYLGAAYGQLGRTMDAIQTITKAVQLQPANAQARYNLGVAMEQGGYRDQAIVALGQALTLQPDYPKAQEALNRLQTGGVSPTQSGTDAGAAPNRPGETQSAPAYGAFPQARTSEFYHTQQPFGQPAGEQPSIPFGAPSSARGEEGPAQQAGFGDAGPALGGAASPIGGTQISRGSEQRLFGAPPPTADEGPGAYGSAAPRTDLTGASSPYSPAARGPYSPGPEPDRFQAPASPYASNSPYPQQVRNRSDGDAFDLVQAARDWGRVLIQPGPFFREKTGSAGMLAPISLALLYLIPMILASMLRGAKAAAVFHSMPGLGPLFASGGVAILLLVGLPIAVAGLFLMAWLFHLIGLLFNNRSPYSSSFRALVYAYAPFPIFGLVSALIPSNPLTSLITLIGLVWGLVLLVMAISSEQEISVGAGVAVVVLGFIASFIVLIAVAIVLGLIIASLAVAAGSRVG